MKRLRQKKSKLLVYFKNFVYICSAKVKQTNNNKHNTYMKKLFTLLLALVATTALWAEDFEVDGIYYKILTDKTNEVEVTYGSPQYTGSVTIPSTVTYNGTTYSVTSIGNYAFYDCSGLTSVTLGNSVTSIGDCAFYNCSSLTSVTIPNSVTSIGDEVFRGCSDLTSITIPNSVTSIGWYAFLGCSGLTSINIPNSVTSIGGGAFYECSGLTSITIPNSVTSIGTSAFYGCSGLTSITIPNSVTSIGIWAFLGCSGLTNPVYNAHCFAYMPTSYEGAYTIPEGIKQIAGGAFYKCSSLTSVTIPNSVTEINSVAFDGCSSLTSVTIPNSVTSIGNYAFSSCESLKEVICYAEKVPQMGQEVFDYTPQSEATLYVLADALEDYKITEQWKEFGTILPIQETDTDLENTHSQSANCQKILRDGHLLIIRDGKTYNAQGVEL